MLHTTFENEFACGNHLDQISQKCLPEGPVNNVSAFVEVMAWRRTDHNQSITLNNCDPGIILGMG